MNFITNLNLFILGYFEFGPPSTDGLYGSGGEDSDDEESFRVWQEMTRGMIESDLYGE